MKPTDGNDGTERPVNFLFPGSGPGPTSDEARIEAVAGQQHLALGVRVAAKMRFWYSPDVLFHGIAISRLTKTVK